MALKIEDYALIGDCETAALVGRDGSIDWLCWPRFDSDACFAALLGDRENGRFLLSPRDEITKISRAYRKDTLILETHFETRTGAVTVIDFMALRGRHSHLVRIVRGDRGEVAMRSDLVLRFGYGAAVPWVVRLDERTLRAVAGPDMVIVRAPVRLHGQNLTTIAEFTVKAGERVPFVLTYARSHQDPPAPLHADKALAATENFWTDWVARGRTNGPYADLIKRSLITLKALTYPRTGGIIAAPTTSLPERIGGERNWDYRYCWVRDATLTLLALVDAGYLDEARAWRDWLLRAVAGAPAQMQIMYGIAGERRLTEWTVPWLAGYEKSQPVRIGNAAHIQLQLDVYGELMDVLHQSREAGLVHAEAGWALQLALLEHLEKVWREPDSGIWEVRGPPLHFTYSKMMAWVAFDRAIKGVEHSGLNGPVEKWKAIREEIHRDVMARGFDPDLNSFVRSYGSKDLDACLLLIPSIGFLPPRDPRVQSTIALVEKRLMRDGFLLRYDTATAEDDGLPAGEGAFLACSFWLADAYVLSGRYDEAEKLFERLAGLANDVGLLSEEYDPAGKRMVGNFPQAFSHIALVGAAFNLTRAEKPARQRAEHKHADAQL